MNVDFGRTAGDYSRHRAGFPASLFEKLRGFGIGFPGQKVVDLGTGTGSLVRGFARLGCPAVGIDISPAMLTQAQELDLKAGVRVGYFSGKAEQVGLPDSYANVVSAGQCWHWFNRSDAAQEAFRILHKGGKIVIAHFDWIPLSKNVVEVTENLIQRHNPLWKMGGGNGLYPLWLRDLSEVGFIDLQTFSYDVMVPYTHRDWRGRIRASAGVGASLSEDQILKFDDELGNLLAELFPEPILQVHHRVFALIGNK